MRVAARLGDGGRRRGKTKAARFDWKDGTTRILVGFTAKGNSKRHVGLAHERLPDAMAAKQAKEYWRERVTALKALLEG